MNNSRTSLLIGGVVLLVIIIVVGLFTMDDEAPAPPEDVDRADPPADVRDDTIPSPPELTPEQATDVLSKHHKGLAYLENGEYDESGPLLDAVAAAYPTPTTLLNLAIDSLLSLGEAEVAAGDTPKQNKMTQARDVISRLQMLETGDALPSFLLGKLETVAGDINAAVAAYEAATQADPDAPVYHYAIYEAVKNRPTPELTPIGAAALERTHELVPENLWVLSELLISQLEREDPAIVQTIERADKAFDFIKAGILKRTRLNLDQSFDAARAAVAESNWSAAAGQVRRVVNVARPEVAVQLDRGKVAPHLLEFIAFDIGIPERTLAVPGESIDVKLVPAYADAEPLNIAGLRSIELIDFDLDGKLDIVAATEKSIHVLSRTGDEDEWTSLIKYDSPQPIEGLVVADLDRDTAANTVSDGVGCATADVDIIAYGPEGVQILLNEIVDGARRLQAVEQVEKFQQLRGVLMIAAVDIDHEGDFDLVVSSEAGLSFWTNLGNMQFEELVGRASLPPEDFRPTSMLPLDINRDITIDLFMTDGATGQAGRLINLRHGEFVWQGFDMASTGRVDKVNRPARVQVGNINGAGGASMMVGGENGILHYGWVDHSPTDAERIPARTITEAAVTDFALWDYNNDGPFDLIAASETGLKIWRGARGAEFSAVDDLVQTDTPLQDVQLVDVGDIDGDGDIDVAVATSERIVILNNDGGNQNNWLNVALRAQATPDRPQERVNIYGIGSTLEVKIGDEYLTRVVDQPVTHFGLGQHKVADVVRLVWPNGLPINVVGPEANTTICEEQRLLSSCAFLYAWNGERFDFVTDLLWNAPIGLPIAEGEYIPPREWEYLHLSSEQLKPNDGYYTLQVTEELWEAAYFDEIELIAVDYPEGVEIVSNEKVGPPSVAEYKLHTVSERRVPIRAVNHTGRDLLPEVLNEDGVYAQPFERRIKQGLVDQHYVELDLGDLENPRQITLYLRGWMYPTGPSVNIAISQNPGITPATPPALSVPDADGEWREVIPFTGFPGGKTKTIAIDLSNAFLTDDYRLRLSTNMEFYWDAIYFTVDQPAVELRETKLSIDSADLHFRGLSKMSPGENNGPEFFDYETVITEPFWSPMRGKFTRFGDVKELLTASDDELLVMGPGDEVTIRWKVPETPPPEGWKRDFILHNVGWNKDDDLNTAYGRQVEPLPFVGMEQYPYHDVPERLQSPEYLDYVKTYQTRIIQGRFLGRRP